MDRSDTPSCRIAAKAKHDDPMRMCIAGFRSTMEAIRHHESTRGGMNHTPTLFLLGVDAAVRHSLEGVVAAGGCSLEYHSTARSFLQAYDPTRPGCVVLDIATVASDASELQKKLSSGNLPLPIIILAGEGPLPQISRGFSLGPVDLLRKPVDASELCRAVTNALARDQEARCRIGLIAELRARAAQLTPQEQEVMRLMVQGLAQKHIAAKLKISTRTVQLRRTAVMRKMQAASLAELVQFLLILNSPAATPETAPADMTQPNPS